MIDQQVNEADEQTANPYNAKKAWAQEQDEDFVSSESLFFDKPEATPEAKAKATPETDEEKTYKKRYDDLKKHYDRKVSEFKQKEEELLAEAKIAAPAYTPPKSVEELEAFKKKHPDLYQTVETVAHLQNQKEISGIQKELVSIKQRETELAKREAMDELRKDHPDIDSIKEDDNFHEWVKSQPDEIQGWVYTNATNAALASRAIDLYKLESGRQKRPRRDNTSADMVSTKTKSVDVKSPKIWTQREINSMSIDDFDKYEEDINQAIHEGRVRR